MEEQASSSQELSQIDEPKDQQKISKNQDSKNPTGINFYIYLHHSNEPTKFIQYLVYQILDKYHKSKIKQGPECLIVNLGMTATVQGFQRKIRKILPRQMRNFIKKMDLARGYNTYNSFQCLREYSSKDFIKHKQKATQKIDNDKYISFTQFLELDQDINHQNQSTASCSNIEKKEDDEQIFHEEDCDQMIGETDGKIQTEQPGQNTLKNQTQQNISPDAPEQYIPPQYTELYDSIYRATRNCREEPTEIEEKPAETTTNKTTNMKTKQEDHQLKSNLKDDKPEKQPKELDDFQQPLPKNSQKELPHQKLFELKKQLIKIEHQKALQEQEQLKKQQQSQLEQEKLLAQQLLQQQQIQLQKQQEIIQQQQEELKKQRILSQIQQKQLAAKQRLLFQQTLQQVDGGFGEDEDPFLQPIQSIPRARMSQHQIMQSYHQMQDQLQRKIIPQNFQQTDYEDFDEFESTRPIQFQPKIQQQQQYLMTQQLRQQPLQTPAQISRTKIHPQSPSLQAQQMKLQQLQQKQLYQQRLLQQQLQRQDTQLQHQNRPLSQMQQHQQIIKQMRLQNPLQVPNKSPQSSQSAQPPLRQYTQSSVLQQQLPNPAFPRQIPVTPNQLRPQTNLHQKNYIQPNPQNPHAQSHIQKTPNQLYPQQLQKQYQTLQDLPFKEEEDEFIDEEYQNYQPVSQKLPSSLQQQIRKQQQLQNLHQQFETKTQYSADKETYQDGEEDEQFEQELNAQADYQLYSKPNNSKLQSKQSAEQTIFPQQQLQKPATSTSAQQAAQKRLDASPENNKSAPNNQKQQLQMHQPQQQQKQQHEQQLPQARQSQTPQVTDEDFQEQNTQFSDQLPRDSISKQQFEEPQSYVKPDLPKKQQDSLKQQPEIDFGQDQTNYYNQQSENYHLDEQHYQPEEAELQNDESEIHSNEDIKEYYQLILRQQQKTLEEQYQQQKLLAEQMSEMEGEELAQDLEEEIYLTSVGQQSQEEEEGYDQAVFHQQHQEDPYQNQVRHQYQPEQFQGQNLLMRKQIQQQNLRQAQNDHQYTNQNQKPQGAPQLPSHTSKVMKQEQPQVDDDEIQIEISEDYSPDYPQSEFPYDEEYRSQDDKASVKYQSNQKQLRGQQGAIKNPSLKTFEQERRFQFSFPHQFQQSQQQQQRQNHLKKQNQLQIQQQLSETQSMRSRYGAVSDQVTEQKSAYNDSKYEFLSELSSITYYKHDCQSQLSENLRHEIIDYSKLDSQSISTQPKRSLGQPVKQVAQDGANYQLDEKLSLDSYALNSSLIQEQRQLQQLLNQHQAKPIQQNASRCPPRKPQFFTFDNLDLLTSNKKKEVEQPKTVNNLENTDSLPENLFY